MTKSTVNEVIKRAVSDAAFRRQLQRDPSGTLAGFELTAEERAAITGGDPAKLTSLGIDQRMSKAFAIGGLMGASNSVIEVDPGYAAGDEVIAADTRSAGGRSGALSDPARSEDMSAVSGTDTTGDLNVIDAGHTEGVAAAREAASAGGRSAALSDPARNEDMGATAFEPASESGDLNVIDPGIVTNDTDAGAAGDADTGTDAGDVRPTEY